MKFLLESDLGNKIQCQNIIYSQVFLADLLLSKKCRFLGILTKLICYMLIKVSQYVELLDGGIRFAGGFSL